MFDVDLIADVFARRSLLSQPTMTGAEFYSSNASTL